jgi:hypothetical protein
MAVLTELIQIFFEAAQRVPVTGNEQKHREFRAERGHATFFDITPTREYDLGQILNDTRSIISNC